MKEKEDVKLTVSSQVKNMKFYAKNLLQKPYSNKRETPSGSENNTQIAEHNAVVKFLSFEQQDALSSLLLIVKSSEPIRL